MRLQNKAERSSALEMLQIRKGAPRRNAERLQSMSNDLQLKLNTGEGSSEEQDKALKTARRG